MGAFLGSIWGPLLISLVLGLPRLRFPMGDDAAVFANAAQTILNGGTLYRDIWFNGLPLNPLLFAALGKICGLNTVTPHLLHLLESLAGVALVYFAGNLALGRKQGLYGAYVFGLVSMLFVTFDVVAEPEFLAGLAGIVATILLLIGLDRQQRKLESGYGDGMLILGAGIVSGVAISAKPVALPLVIVSLFWIWNYHRRFRFRHIFYYTLGTAIVPFALLIWLATGDAIGDMIEQFVVWNSYYARDREPFPTWMLRQVMLALFLLGPVLPLAATGGALMTRELNGKRVWLLLWAGAGVATVAIQPNPWSYHWFLALPALCLLAADAVVNARKVLESRPLFWALGLSIAISAISMQAVADNGGKSVLAIRSLFPGGSEAEFWDEFPCMGGTMADVKQVTSYLADHTNESDPVFIWMPTSAYAMAERRPASKYTFLWPLVYGPEESRARARNELMSDLRENRPHYIVLPVGKGWYWRMVNMSFSLDPFPELVDFVATNYNLDVVLAESAIYRLREQAALHVKSPSASTLYTNLSNPPSEMQEEGAL